MYSVLRSCNRNPTCLGRLTREANVILLASRGCTNRRLYKEAYRNWSAGSYHSTLAGNFHGQLTADQRWIALHGDLRYLHYRRSSILLSRWQSTAAASNQGDEDESNKTHNLDNECFKKLPEQDNFAIISPFNSQEINVNVKQYRELCTQQTHAPEPPFIHQPVGTTKPKISAANQNPDENKDELFEEKSKVEEFVKHQKRKKEARRLRMEQRIRDAFLFQPDSTLIKTKPTKTVAKKPMKERVIEEVKHYYNGFRLLALDVRIAARMLWQVLNGKTLTRRERKQFLRTAADLFRLVPFSVFLIVPFMEFLLPVAIKLFPNMLPSTFEDKSKVEEKKRQSIRMKLEMAKFLQDTIEEIAVVKSKGKNKEKLQKFSEFVRTVRSEGESPITKQILEYSKLFEDEITLEHMAFPQLRAMCRLLMISPVGTNNFLQFKIKMKLKELKADDKLIRKEGVDNMTEHELQQACVARAMRGFGVPVDRLRANLKQWLELSLDHKVPASLLLLSRPLYMGPHLAYDELKMTIQQFPERIIDELEVKIGALEGEEVDRQTIIDIIKHEEDKIQEEKLESEKKTKEDEARKVKMRKAVEVAEELLDSDSGDLSKEELLKVKETLHSDRETLAEIKEDRDEYVEDVVEMLQVKRRAKESVASSRLGKRIDKMLKKIDTTLCDLEESVSHLPDGKIDMDEDGVITTNELYEAVLKLRNAPNEAKTKRLVEVLDANSDGEIDLDELKLALELLAKEDLELSESQITEVVALIQGTEKIYIIEQQLKKRKSNYILRLLPEVYGRRPRDDVLKSTVTHWSNLKEFPQKIS